VKIGGVRLHDLARKGIEVDRAPRPVTIYRLEVRPTDDPLVVRLDVTCSAGTYIRVLAADLGHALGGGAHLRQLRRTAIGPHTEADARPLEAIELRPVADAVAHLPVAVTAEVDLVATGRLPALALDGDGPWAVTDVDGNLLAVAERDGDRIKPAVVLAAR
jgi:tRNA pseudouridine55 synthase